MASQLLSALEVAITQNRGAIFEADIFALLSDYPEVVRAFEFATVDGCLDCTAIDFLTKQSFAQRLLTVDEDMKLQTRPIMLVPFDVKSTTAGEAGDQIFVTSIRQQQEVAFYVCICAADPRYVEVIPNKPLAEATSELGRYVAVNTSRKLSLASSCYGRLDPCGAPYRMPLTLLPDAMGAMVDCALGRRAYVNPWTQVSFTGWTPRTVQSVELLKPAESSEHFTGYRGLMEIFRATRAASSVYNLYIEFDFVGVQPRLADFKWIVRGQRQVFVQYKIDGRDRALNNPLRDVSIARGSGTTSRHYYFSALNRFDFLLYQFNFSNRPNPNTILHFFLIPERLLPDSFYESQEKEADFSVAEFKPYRIVADDHGAWIHQVLAIIESETEPQAQKVRPVRAAELDTATARKVREVVQREQMTGSKGKGKDRADRHGPAAIAALHVKFFTTVMSQCALRLSGIIVALARKHPLGDFAFCRYQWTLKEREVYLRSGIPPVCLHQLPAATPAVALYAFARDAESSSRGPTLTAADFRRVNASCHNRLLLFDPIGPDGAEALGPLFLMPSNDLSAREEHLAVYRSNLKDCRTERAQRVPYITQLLHSGLAITDYTIAARGPLFFDAGDDAWYELWELLQRFCGTVSFEHPGGFLRAPTDYQITVQSLHERLVEEHRVSGQA